MTRGAYRATETARRDLRTGRPLWADSYGLKVDARPLREPVDVDVAIVGAGISGGFMAQALSRDHSVAVFDRRPPLTGSTMASTAMLQWELDLPLFELARKIGPARAGRAYRRSRAALDDLKTLVRAERIRCGLADRKSLYLAGDAYGARALKAEADARADLGLESVFLPAAELRARFGLDRTGAILSQGSASADPARLAAGLLRRAVANGARIFSPVEVEGVLQGKDHVVLETDVGVEVRARQVAFCCGYEFPKGAPTHAAKVISTWALATRPVREPPPWMVDHIAWEASDPYLYFRMTRDGRIVVGGEDEASPTRHADKAALGVKARRILRKLEALVPGLDLTIDYAWAGAFGESATSLPLIGPVPDLPRAYAVMGFGGNGITYSIVASQVVGAAIRGRPDPDADLFAFA